MSAVPAVLAPARRGLWRYSAWDAVVAGLSVVQAGILAALALAVEGSGGWGVRVLAALVVGGLVCWSANTVAHIHLHKPIFRSRGANRAFSVWLSALTWIPQTLWTHRHRWHHAGEPSDYPAYRPGGRGALELAAIGAVVALGLWAAPGFVLAVWAPGYLLGLLLCQQQGAHEHRTAAGEAPGGVSCYGRLHNLLWLNDGYHAEHHRWPGLHWTRLPERRLEGAPTSRLAPPLRGLEGLQSRLLCALERGALASGLLQRFMVRSHRRAFARLLPRLAGAPRRVGIVGGGLFPRTVLALQELLPEAQLVVLEACPVHVAAATRVLGERGLGAGRVRFESRFVRPGALGDFDLVVVPLAFIGDKSALYAGQGPPTLVHEWAWRRRGAASTMISWALLKRLNLTVTRAG